MLSSPADFSFIFIVSWSKKRISLQSIEKFGRRFIFIKRKEKNETEKILKENNYGHMKMVSVDGNFGKKLMQNLLPCSIIAERTREQMNKNKYLKSSIFKIAQYFYDGIRV